MKKFILALIMLVSCVNNSSADTTIVRNGNVFKIESTTSKVKNVNTGFKLEVKGTQYPIFKSSKGRMYIIRTSKKTNKEYKQYLDKEVQSKIESTFSR